MGALAFSILVIFYVVSYHREEILKEQIGERLMAIAVTAASQFKPEDLEQLRFAEDMKKPVYQRVFEQMNEIRNSNKEIKWIYILRPTDQVNVWEFVADADANYFLDVSDDINLNGVNEPSEENVFTGMKYYSENESLLVGLKKPSYTKDYEIDQWGTVVTGVAPIGSGYVLGIDMGIEEVLN